MILCQASLRVLVWNHKAFWSQPWYSASRSKEQLSKLCKTQILALAGFGSHIYGVIILYYCTVHSIYLWLAPIIEVSNIVKALVPKQLLWRPREPVLPRPACWWSKLLGAEPAAKNKRDIHGFCFDCCFKISTWTILQSTIYLQILILQSIYYLIE